jgi:dTDP-4-dehydrorhamnose 3,5-epimerase
LVSYKCTTAYQPANEYCLRWDDPEIAIDWPVDHPSLSDKDAKGFLLNDLPAQALQEHEN